ncbi:peptidoglycan-N-acetylglucosamine deacetylase [Entomortierella parvispora]|uniref:Peptidoglycan-N-acetylglucosamine deacetylase n=1 Tax=Entomortierella parvispora TaxID=205924 RepID=A0A9P3HED0_9FUNG|nr:peptidoglycan-N-acetylglucosamine deacetylase [Entomortierella parvispora]
MVPISLYSHRDKVAEPASPSESSLTHRRSRRRHAALFALIVMIGPMLVAHVTDAHRPPSSISTEEAMRLLSSPAAGSAGAVTGTSSSSQPSSTLPDDIDYHGIVHHINSTLSPPADEALADKQEEEKEESSGQELEGQHQQSRSRMRASLYPTKDTQPDVNSPQVKAWVAEIDWSKVPNIPVAPGLPDVPHFPKCPPDNLVDRSSCWWSCSGCVAPSDVVTCPDKNAWGLTYDDGPSLATRDMMTFLGEKQLTATFFIVGSRVLEYPDILKEQVARGHHIAMHTWSHAGLTTLTNHQIVAEIRWTEKIIRDVTGLTMKYVRPPYGDTDNRVREILRQMGYTTVIWTSGWDTNDWRMLQHQVEKSEILRSFQSALSTRTSIRSQTGQPGGPITLEHDLSEDTINLSKTLIPMAEGQGLKPMSLATCLNDATPYQRGSRLGPGGATEKINNGDSTSWFGGMEGMEEQDFSPVQSRTRLESSRGKKNDATALQGSSLSVGQLAMQAGLALMAVASVMMTL